MSNSSKMETTYLPTSFVIKCQPLLNTNYALAGVTAVSLLVNVFFILWKVKAYRREKLKTKNFGVVTIGRNRNSEKFQERERPTLKSLHDPNGCFVSVPAIQVTCETDGDNFGTPTANLTYAEIRKLQSFVSNNNHQPAKNNSEASGGYVDLILDRRFNTNQNRVFRSASGIDNRARTNLANPFASSTPQHSHHLVGDDISDSELTYISPVQCHVSKPSLAKSELSEGKNRNQAEKRSRLGSILLSVPTRFTTNVGSYAPHQQRSWPINSTNCSSSQEGLYLSFQENEDICYPRPSNTSQAYRPLMFAPDLWLNVFD